MTVASVASSLNSAHGKAGYQPVEEEIIDDAGGDSYDDGRRQQRLPEENVAPDKLGRHTHADRPLG